VAAVVFNDPVFMAYFSDRDLGPIAAMTLSSEDGMAALAGHLGQLATVVGGTSPGEFSGRTNIHRDHVTGGSADTSFIRDLTDVASFYSASAGVTITQLSHAETHATVQIVFDGDPLPVCGDGTCNSGETCGDCPADCGACPTCAPSGSSCVLASDCCPNSCTGRKGRKTCG